MSAPIVGESLSQSFRRGFAATFALDIIAKVIAAVTVVVLIRGLSVSNYAYVTLFLTVAQFAGSAAGGGVRTRYLREEAEGYSRGARTHQEDAFFLSLLKATLLIFAIGICTLPLAWMSGVGSGFAEATGLVTFATVFAAGFSAGELAIARYQARRRFGAAGAINVARAAALLVASIMIVVSREDVVVITAWLVAAVVVVGTISTAPLFRSGVAMPERKNRWLDREEIWLSLYYVFAASFAYVDVMVAAVLLSDEEVATLGASLRYLAIVSGPIPAIGAVLRVRTAQVDLVESISAQRTMILTWLRRTALPAGVFILIVLAAAPVVIPQVDGGKYPDSVIVLQVFLVVAFSAYVTAPAVSILMTQRRYGLLSRIYSVGFLVNLAGDLAVAPHFGVVGIALVSTAVYVAIDVILISHALRYGGRPVARGEPTQAGRAAP